MLRPVRTARAPTAASTVEIARAAGKTLRRCLEAAGHPYGGARGHALAPAEAARRPPFCGVFPRAGRPGAQPRLWVGAVQVPEAAVGRHLVVAAPSLGRRETAVLAAVVRAVLPGPPPRPAVVRAALDAVAAAFVTVTVVAAAPGGFEAVDATGLLRARAGGPSPVGRPRRPRPGHRLSRIGPPAVAGPVLSVELVAWGA